MSFFFRNRKGTINANVKVADVYVVTSTITSSYNAGTGGVPMDVTMYFLAKCEDGEYYELFSGKKLGKEKQFDTPYVKKAEPLTDYLGENNKVIKIDIHSLFDFITNMNVLDKLESFSAEEDEEYGEDEKTSREF